MKAVFAPVSNVDRLLVGIAHVQKRGAREANLLLVTSAPGFGKSETLAWYAAQQTRAIYIRAKSGYTRHWFFRDVLSELGIQPMRHAEDLFCQVMAVMAGRDYLMVVDEVEHALADGRVIEAIRDVSDMTDTRVVLVGMEQVREKIRSRYPQISSRIAAVVTFQPLGEEDIQIAAQTLLEGITVADDVVQEIRRNCEGRMRLVLNGLAVCERVAKARKASHVCLADLEDQELIHDWTNKAKVTPLQKVAQ